MASPALLDQILARFPEGVDVHAALDPRALSTRRAVALRVESIDRAVVSARYPAAHPVTLVESNGAERSSTLHAALDAPGDARWLVLAPLDPLADLADPGAVARIAARLRAPDGCPWDREQTHASLRPNLLEETYEALDALDAGDMDRFADELGDLLFQIAIHAQLAEEDGRFDFGTVSRAIGEKLVRRHPHVFAGRALEGDALRQWEQIKRAESGESGEPRSIVQGIPRSLPALFAAERLQERTARVGLVPARVELPLDVDDPAFLGDVLFDLVGEARERGFDAETALREANARYAARVVALEIRARAGGRELETYTPEELRNMWEESRGTS